MRKWLIPITLVCFMSAFFLAFQLKVQANNTNINPLSQKNTNLVTIIKDLEAEIASQEDQIEKARNDISAMQNQQTKGQIKELQEELMRIKVVAGLTSVAGPGIIIVLDDNKDGLNANPNDDPNKYIIHYEHILNLVSDLKAGGAEAISINGQRLITTSEIRCVGNVILVNTTRIAPPFEIRVIGSPKILGEIASSRELDILKTSGFPVTIKEDEKVIIPAYKGDLQFNYSQIVKKEG